MSTLSIDAVLTAPALPTLPKVAIDVIEMTGDPNVTLPDIAAVVQHDQALAGKILRTVNSSYYALAKPCPTVSRAMAYLGINSVKSLVLGFSLVDVTRGARASGFSLTEYWRRSLYSAAAARLIARRQQSADAEEAFLAAIMQDVGVIAMLTTEEAVYRDVLAECDGNHDRLAIIESRVLGFTHAEVGARLAEQWRLPPRLIDPIRFHHAPDAPPTSEEAAIVRCICVANRVATALTTGGSRQAIEDVFAACDRLFGWTGDDVRDVLMQSAEDARHLSELLRIDIDAPPNFNAVLQAAEDARIAHSLRLHQEAASLRERNDRLERTAKTDGLTQIANRVRFEELLAGAFDRARRSGAPFALVMLDVDAFKALNDRYGHQVGDLVLTEIARRTDDCVGERGVVCRYGGEEFVVLLPGAECRRAGRIAETIRRRLADEPVCLGAVDRHVAVTASLGVAAWEPRAAKLYGRAEILLKAADRALYAAKAGGRNCVRVFVPRPLQDAA